MIKKRSSQYMQGMTLVELIIVIFIFGMIAVATAQFQVDVFRLTGLADKSLNAVFNSRQVLKVMATELRSASPSSTGSYPLQAIATSTITFYSDIDDDGVKERVRYFMQGTNLIRGIIEPTGNPFIYNSASEATTTLVQNVRNATSTNLFDYFDTDYDGTTAPLSNPPTSDVRLVRITIKIDEDPNRPPAALTSTTQVSIRNLKDNL